MTLAPPIYARVVYHLFQYEAHISHHLSFSYIHNHNIDQRTNGGNKSLERPSAHILSKSRRATSCSPKTRRSSSWWRVTRAYAVHKWIRAFLCGTQHTHESVVKCELLGKNWAAYHWTADWALWYYYTDGGDCECTRSVVFIYAAALLPPSLTGTLVHFVSALERGEIRDFYRGLVPALSETVLSGKKIWHLCGWDCIFRGVQANDAWALALMGAKPGHIESWEYASHQCMEWQIADIEVVESNPGVLGSLNSYWGI